MDGRHHVFFAAINSAHVHHFRAHSWLEQARPDGWAIGVETFLGSVRLLMNAKVMHGHPLGARDALRIVRAELSGRGSGAVLVGDEPDDRFLKSAEGHRQVMDFYLVQLAAAKGCKLATFDGGIQRAWPSHTHAVP